MAPGSGAFEGFALPGLCAHLSRCAWRAGSGLGMWILEQHSAADPSGRRVFRHRPAGLVAWNCGDSPPAETRESRRLHT